MVYGSPAGAVSCTGMNRATPAAHDGVRPIRVDASIDALVAAADVPVEVSPRDGLAGVLAACTEAAGVREGALLTVASDGALSVAAATSRHVSRHLSAAPLDAARRCLESSEAHVHTFRAPAVPLDPLARDGAPLSFRRGIFVPMRHQKVTVAVLALLDRHEDPPSPPVLALVQGVADVSAAVLEHSRLIEAARTFAMQLQEALASRVVLEQAKGMLAERTASDPESAFRTLREAARRQRRTVATVAADVVGRRPGGLD